MNSILTKACNIFQYKAPLESILLPFLSLFSALFLSMGLFLHNMHCNKEPFPAQIPELAKCSVLMRERSRVEETIHAMQLAGPGSLQVRTLTGGHIHTMHVWRCPFEEFDYLSRQGDYISKLLQNQLEICVSVLPQENRHAFHQEGECHQNKFCKRSKYCWYFIVISSFPLRKPPMWWRLYSGL